MSLSMTELNSISTLKTWPSGENTFRHLSWIDRPEGSSEGLFRPGEASQLGYFELQLLKMKPLI